jgi:hypothetical protein
MAGTFNGHPKKMTDGRWRSFIVTVKGTPMDNPTTTKRMMCPHCLLNGIYRWYDQCPFKVSLVPIKCEETNDA